MKRVNATQGFYLYSGEEVSKIFIARIAVP